MDNRIAYLRQGKGLSLQDLATATQTTKAQIQKLERGERRLSLDWMKRIAGGLQVKVSELLPEDEIACRHSAADQEILAIASDFEEPERLVFVRIARDLMFLMKRLDHNGFHEDADDTALGFQLKNVWGTMNDDQRAWALQLLGVARRLPVDPAE